MKISYNSKVGWLPKSVLKDQEEIQWVIHYRVRNPTKVSGPLHTNEIPQRVEQLYRQRKIAQLLDKVREVKPSDRRIGVVKGDHRVDMYTKVPMIVTPHTSKIVEIEPKKKVEMFLMVEPTEEYKSHTKLEVLDGSYYTTHGGLIDER